MDPNSIQSADPTETELRRQKGLRPTMPAYHETPLLSIGKCVRIQVSSDRRRRATIQYVDEADGTVDVAFERTAREQQASGDRVRAEDVCEDEATVPIAAVAPLEDFEVRDDSAVCKEFADDLYTAAAYYKDCANKLFKMQDFEAAADHYARVIEELRRFRAVSSAADCWVLVNHGGALVAGAVSVTDMPGQIADVTLQSSTGAAQVVCGVPWRVLIPVHASQLQLQSSLYMNSARALSQLGRHQEAAQNLSVALGLWSADCQSTASHVSDSERHEQKAKALFLRAKARLARLRVAPARADLKEALALDPPEAMCKQLRQLEREIELAQREQVRSNKRLAKEIAKFADSAMSQMDEAQLAALGQGAAEE